MPPQLAVLLSLLLTALLIWWDRRRRPDVSAATWIPTLWLLVVGSRSVTQWIYLGTPDDQIGAGIVDGSALDRNFFLVLILCSLVVLIRRGIEWQHVARHNGWFILFLAYCLISVAWSDYPVVSFKRWFKALGDPLIVLVLLTERNPATAITAVLRRIAFILIPLSIVFIKYFPEVGRTYSDWTGEANYTGVTTNKNLLGYLLFVTGLLFLCTWAERKRITDRVYRRVETGICLLFLTQIVYLFNLATSRTALVALITAGAIALAVNARSVRRHISAIAIVLLVSTWVIMTSTWGGSVLTMLGRDATLTGRTDLWAAVLPMAVHPLFGAGFESFWLGQRLAALWDMFAFRPNQAHNGYIDLYLNLGAVGLGLFIAFVVSSFVVIRRVLLTAYASLSTMSIDQIVLARFAIGYIIAMVAYNVTEATFKSLNFLFIVLLVTAFRYRRAIVVQPDPATAMRSRRGPVHGSAPGASVHGRPQPQAAGRQWAYQRRRPVHSGWR